MIGSDKVYNALKALMLMNERFDRIEGELGSLSDDLGKLAGSHVEVAQRVAVIEGYLRGRADQAAAQSEQSRISND